MFEQNMWDSKRPSMEVDNHGRPPPVCFTPPHLARHFNRMSAMAWLQPSGRFPSEEWLDDTAVGLEKGKKARFWGPVWVASRFAGLERDQVPSSATKILQCCLVLGRRDQTFNKLVKTSEFCQWLFRHIQSRFLHSP